MQRIVFVCSEPVKEEPKEPVDPAVRAKQNWLRLFEKVRRQLQEVRLDVHFCRKSIVGPRNRLLYWFMSWFMHRMHEFGKSQLTSWLLREEKDACLFNFALKTHLHNHCKLTLIFSQFHSEMHHVMEVKWVANNIYFYIFIHIFCL